MKNSTNENVLEMSPPMDDTFVEQGVEELELDFRKDLITSEESEEDEDRPERRICYQQESHWQRIKGVAKSGVKSTGTLILVMGLLGILNIGLLAVALIKLFFIDFEMMHLLWIGTTILVGSGFLFFAWIRTNQYAILKTMGSVYSKLDFVLEKICILIAEKVISLYKKGEDITKEKFPKVIDFGEVVNGSYQKIPKFIRKGLIFILNRVPFVELIMGITQGTINSDTEELGELLFEKSDEYIRETFFESNNLRWLWWAVPCNFISLLLINLLLIV